MSTDCDALWLYGSYARGQADDRSDCDVLAISDMPVQKEKAVKLSGLSEMSLSISRYSWIELDSMAAYGSLFLQHLRLEGKCLYEGPGFEGRLAELLSRLGPYRRACFDLQCYRDCIGDVYDSLSQASSALYEVSVLATVIRHASILGCFLLGVPDFGRLSPVINELPPEFRLPWVTYNRRHHERGDDEDTEAGIHRRVQGTSGHTS